MRALLACLLTALPMLAFAQEAATVAADAAAPAAPSPMASMLPLLLIFVVFYFLLIKPQQKRMKEHQAMLGGLKKGDEVVTGGGIIGKITKVGDADSVTVEIASGVEVKVLKSTVTGLVSAIPASPHADKKKAGDKKNDNVVPSRESVANDN